MKLSHEEAARRLAAAVVEGALDVALRQHLEACAQCRNRVEDLQRLAGQIRAVRVEPSPVLTARTQALLRWRSEELQRRRPLRWAAALGGAVVLLESLATFRLLWDLAGRLQFLAAHTWLWRLGVVMGCSLVPAAILLLLVTVLMDDRGSGEAWMTEELEHV